MDSAGCGWRVDGEARPRQGRRGNARIRRRPLLGVDGPRQAGRARRRGARRSRACRRLEGGFPRTVGQATNLTLPRMRGREIYGVAAFLLALLGQQALVALALKHRTDRDGSRDRLTLVDGITLSRGATGALITGLVASGVRERRGFTGWIGWIALLYGAIVSDWLDGPIARRLGTSEVGAMFDIEADSWLTLCSSAAAVSWGGLPAYVVAPPVARYLRLAALGRLIPYPPLVCGPRLWPRHIGMAQMTLFIAALAPFSGRATRLLVRIGTPVVVAGQLFTLAVVSWRKLKAEIRRES